MKTIIIRGEGNSGKTTTAKMAYDQLAKIADNIHLFDHYNQPLEKLQYSKETGEVYDFKAILKIKGKIVVIITAGDEPWRLMINIKFIIDFVKKTFDVEIDILICCGRSHNRRGSVVMRLKEKYPNSSQDEVWVYRVEEKNKQNNKEKAVEEILALVG